MFNVLTQDKDNSLIERLYKQYKHLLYNIAMGILKDHGFAEDAVQTTFIRIMNNLHKIDEVNCHKTTAFLVVICRNVSYNIHNKKTNLNNDEDLVDEIPDHFNENNDDPLDIVINSESIRRLIDTIKTLDSKYQDVILLKYYNGCSYEEISQLLNIPQATVRKRIERAKSQLAKLLNKEKTI